MIMFLSGLVLGLILTGIILYSAEVISKDNDDSSSKLGK